MCPLLILKLKHFRNNDLLDITWLICRGFSRFSRLLTYQFQYVPENWKLSPVDFFRVIVALHIWILFLRYIKIKFGNLYKIQIPDLTLDGLEQILLRNRFVYVLVSVQHRSQNWDKVSVSAAARKLSMKNWEGRRKSVMIFR